MENGWYAAAILTAVSAAIAYVLSWVGEPPPGGWEQTHDDDEDESDGRGR